MAKKIDKVMTDTAILNQAKNEVAKKLSYNSWFDYIQSCGIEPMAVEQAALLALQLKGEQMEKEFKRQIDEVSNMMSTPDGGLYEQLRKQITDLKGELSHALKQNDELRDLLAADYKVMTKEQIDQLCKNDLAKDIKSTLSQREAKAFDDALFLIEDNTRRIYEDGSIESGIDIYKPIVSDGYKTVIDKPVNPYKAKEE